MAPVVAGCGAGAAVFPEDPAVLARAAALAGASGGAAAAAVADCRAVLTGDVAVDGESCDAATASASVFAAVLLGGRCHRDGKRTDRDERRACDAHLPQCRAPAGRLAPEAAPVPGDTGSEKTTRPLTSSK